MHGMVPTDMQIAFLPSDLEVYCGSVADVKAQLCAMSQVT